MKVVWLGRVEFHSEAKREGRTNCNWQRNPNEKTARRSLKTCLLAGWVGVDLDERKKDGPNLRFGQYKLETIFIVAT